MKVFKNNLSFLLIVFLLIGILSSISSKDKIPKEDAQSKKLNVDHEYKKVTKEVNDGIDVHSHTQDLANFDENRYLNYPSNAFNENSFKKVETTEEKAKIEQLYLQIKDEGTRDILRYIRLFERDLLDINIFRVMLYKCLVEQAKSSSKESRFIFSLIIEEIIKLSPTQIDVSDYTKLKDYLAGKKFISAFKKVMMKHFNKKKVDDMIKDISKEDL